MVANVVALLFELGSIDRIVYYNNLLHQTNVASHCLLNPIKFLSMQDIFKTAEEFMVTIF